MPPRNQKDTEAPRSTSIHVEVDLGVREWRRRVFCWRSVCGGRFVEYHPWIRGRGDDEGADGLRIFGSDEFGLFEGRKIAEVDDGAAQAAQKEVGARGGDVS